MFESIVLGAVQGIVEWLPVSSEGAIVLVKTHFFGGGALGETIRLALFLHLGTFFAALIYFWKDVVRLTKALFSRERGEVDTKIIVFLILATFVSGLLGLIILKALGEVDTHTQSASFFINLVVALLLIITGLLQIKARRSGERGMGDLKLSDGLSLGIAQGFAALPGLSRSGLTVSVLLLRTINEEDALKLSFLMSLPIVLLGNIFLNAGELSFSINNFLALASSFAFGYLTIDLLLRVARKVQFGYFLLLFAGVLILSLFV